MQPGHKKSRFCCISFQSSIYLKVIQPCVPGSFHLRGDQAYTSAASTSLFLQLSNSCLPAQPCAMADPLSIAASSFAIVGLVDVVLRTCIEVRDLLSTIQSAPDDIACLKECVNDNVRLLELCKRCIEQMRTSAASRTNTAQADLSRALNELSSPIRSMDRELRALTTLAKKHHMSGKAWAKIKWILDEKRLKKSLERLSEARSQLTISLNVTGLFVESILR